jgi:hypothetical protein
MPDLDAIPPGLTPTTRGAALATALAALDALVELGETIEDEWSYVTALADAGRARLRAASGSVDEMLPADRGAAIVAACVEVARITDPHRAIDWLSTLPAIVELSLGGAPTAPGAGAGAGVAASGA